MPRPPPARMSDAAPALPGFVPGAYARLLDEYLREQGLASEAGAEPPPARLPMQQWRERLQAAAAQLQDPLLGLRLGQRIRPAHFGVLGYLFHACGTLGGALRRLEQYQRLVYDFNPLRVEAGPQSVELVWTTEYGRPGPLVDECAISALLTLMRQIAAAPQPPLAVQFVNPWPADVAPYVQALGGPVHFAASDTRVRLPQALLAAPLAHPDPSLRAVLEGQARQMLEALPPREAIVQRVAAELARQLPDGPPTQAAVAQALGLSTRSLHRALARSGQGWRELLTRTRMELAQRYLRDPRLQLAEIAHLCGYSEQSAFSRAYRAWAGQPPAQARRAL